MKCTSFIHMRVKSGKINYDTKEDERWQKDAQEVKNYREVLHSSCAGGDYVYFCEFDFVVRRLLPAAASSSFSSLISLGRVGRKVVAFQCCKKGLWEVSAESTGLVEEETGDRRRTDGGEEKRDREQKWVGKKGEKTGDTVESRSSLSKINCNQLHRTGDGITSLKIWDSTENLELFAFRQYQLCNWLKCESPR